jgi:hypothetical protein
MASPPRRKSRRLTLGDVVDDLGDCHGSGLSAIHKTLASVTAKAGQLDHYQSVASAQMRETGIPERPVRTPLTRCCLVEYTLAGLCVEFVQLPVE